MRWQKLGRVFEADGQRPWMISHTQNPVAELVQSDVFRVYFTCRDAKNRSHVGWLEIDLSRPNEVLNLAENPLLAPGPSGMFDDAGAMTASVVRHESRRYFYYTGWSNRADSRAPYHLAVGLASGFDDDGPPSVSRLPGPVMERNPIDPLFCCCPEVRVEGSRWRMWYLSGLDWVRVEDRTLPSYHLRYAESDDGVQWERRGTVALELGPDEVGFTRPSIVRENGGYVMWYAVRGHDARYRPGRAVSADGLTWTREDDRTGLDLSSEGWDSEMIAYPHVFNHHGIQYMLYCGNDYGRSGLGLAVRA